MKMHKSAISIQAIAIFVLLFLLSLSSQIAAQDSPSLLQALHANERDVKHLLRDEIRRPLEVIEFLGIGSGMQVLDVYAADGYYSYILSKVVGPQGRVYAQNPAAGSNVEDIRQMYSLADALDEIIESAALNNIEHLRQDLFELEIEPASLDAVMLVQILHDFYNADPDYAAAVLSHLKSRLKPGGIVAIIDHVGEAGQDNRRLHRMQKSQLMALAERVGLTLIGDSNLLENRTDQHRRPVFDPMLGRDTDRFLLKFQN